MATVDILRADMNQGRADWDSIVNQGRTRVDNFISARRELFPSSNPNVVAVRNAVDNALEAKREFWDTALATRRARVDSRFSGGGGMQGLGDAGSNMVYYAAGALALWFLLGKHKL